MILCGAGDLEKPFLMQVEGVYFAMISPYFYHSVVRRLFDLWSWYRRHWSC
jgi:hypothetical protein